MLHGDFDLTLVFFLLFLNGSFRAFYFPAKQAIIPNLVSTKQLPKAIALSSTVSNVAMTGGPLISGLLIALIDLQIYGLLAAALGLAGLAYLLLPRLARVEMAPRTWETLIGGVNYARSNPIVLGAIAIDLFIVLLGSVVTLLPIYALDILFIGPEQLGVLRGMPAFGAVIAGIIWQACRLCANAWQEIIHRVTGVCRLDHLVRAIESLLAQRPGTFCLWRGRHDQREYPDQPCSDGHARSFARTG